MDPYLFQQQVIKQTNAIEARTKATFQVVVFFFALWFVKEGYLVFKYLSS